MASSRPWPFDDDEDRPSGVGATAPPGRPAGHPRPPPRRPRPAAGRYRCGSASGGGPGAGQRGPGGSAQARWRRMRAVEWAAWTRTLPWRVALILGVGAVGAVFGSLLAPQLVLGGLAAVVAGWRLRSGPAPRPVPGDAGQSASGAPPGCSARWRGTGGRSCTTWPSPAAAPTLITWPIGPGGVFVI